MAIQLTVGRRGSRRSWPLAAESRERERERERESRPGREQIETRKRWENLQGCAAIRGGVLWLAVPGAGQASSGHAMICMLCRDGSPRLSSDFRRSVMRRRRRRLLAFSALVFLSGFGVAFAAREQGRAPACVFPRVPCVSSSCTICTISVADFDLSRIGAAQRWDSRRATDLRLVG